MTNPEEHEFPIRVIHGHAFYEVPKTLLKVLGYSNGREMCSFAIEAKNVLDYLSGQVVILGCIQNPCNDHVYVLKELLDEGKIWR